MCDLYGMCGSLFGCASIWTMTMIALDRYNVIVKVMSVGPTISLCNLRSTIIYFRPIVIVSHFISFL
jgi:r-opsin